ncbi:MAG: hypothetical protein HY204_07140 [Nitrospirae bacterium]|nr:hypothetical protein [Nitrospirota bacterium]
MAVLFFVALQQIPAVLQAAATLGPLGAALFIVGYIVFLYLLYIILDAFVDQCILSSAEIRANPREFMVSIFKLRDEKWKTV